MRDDTISAYLGKLAERMAVPAGGATAALNAAQAAALLAMTARYCGQPEHAGAISEIIAEADQLRHACVALMAADGELSGPPSRHPAPTWRPTSPASSTRRPVTG